MDRKHPLAVCEVCPLRERPYAATTGPLTASHAIVSRSPGLHESRVGQAFSGPSGKVLDHLLQLQGLTRDEVIATNVVLCQSDGTEKGWGRAVACCSPRLEHEIQNAETVIACGREAALAIADAPNIGLNRGYVHYRDNGIVQAQRVIVTNNPAVVIRDDSTYPELVRDFRLAINPLPAPKLPKVTWIDDVDKARGAAERVLNSIKGKLVASDIETREDTEIVAAGFAIRPDRAVVFGETVCQSDDGNAILRKLYEAPSRYLWHNGKYDVSVLRRNGIQAKVDEDTLLLSWCLDERPGNPESGAGGHSLEWLLKDVLGWPLYEPPSVRGFKKTGEIDDITELYKYNGYDTAGTLQLFEAFEREARNDGVWDKPYKHMLIQLSEVLTRMELQGNRFDVDQACDILEAEVWPKLFELRREMREQIVRPMFNPNSHKQVTELLYDTWNVHHKLKRPKIELQDKRSGDRFVREEILRGDFTCAIEKPFIESFVKSLDSFKELDKQRGAFFEGLVKRAVDNRIYTRFNIHGTESGRLSSANPNLQNVTRPKDGIPSIRGCFIPDPGCVLVSADLSQAELRTIAVLSGDEELRSIYLDTGRSLHKEVATEFYGDDYTYEQYVRAKNINFGVAYWQSAYSFAQMYNMPRSEADAFIKFWWSRFPKVWEWTKQTEQEVMERGELQSPFGHKRRFYVIPAGESERLHVVKQGINFRPQNIAANITLWGLISLAEKLDWRIAQPRITVHDSILVNCDERHIDYVAHLMRECLEAAPRIIQWTFPYKAEISVGSSWGDMEDFVPNAGTIRNNTSSTAEKVSK